MTDAMFSKPPKRMKQPKKDILRDQLVLSAEAQIEARAQLEQRTDKEYRDYWEARFDDKTNNGPLWAVVAAVASFGIGFLLAWHL